MIKKKKYKDMLVENNTGLFAALCGRGNFMRKNTDDLLVENYNELFEALDDHCASKWRVNLFSHIGFYELVNLNYLLIQFTRFYKAAGPRKFNDIEYGEYLDDLSHLLDKLYDRDLFNNSLL